MTITKTNPFLAMVIANVFLGSSSVLIKIGLETIPTFMLIGARFTMIGALFLFVAHLKNLKSNGSHTLDLLIQIVLQSFLATAWFVALNFTEPINSSIIFLLTPIAVYVGSVVVLHEPRSNRAMAGSLVALVGGLLLFGAPVLSGNTEELIGNGLLLASALILAALIIHTKKISADVPTPIITGVKFLGTGIVGWSLAIGLEDFQGVLVGVSVASSVALILAVITGFFGLYLFYEALRHMRAEESAPLFYIDPLVGSVSSALVLGNSLSPYATAAAIVIICGVAISHPVHLHRYAYYHMPHVSKFEEFLQKMRHRYESIEYLVKKFF